MSLKPWRDVIPPNSDVLEGTFQESEFAADLSKVAEGKASPEYQDPATFFDRTFITEGMHLLLDSVLRRLAGKGGDPVIRLQTAFGGGKTHAMLAVYHLVTSKRPAKELAGIPKILDQAGIKESPRARVAIIDGNALSPSHTRKRDGVEVKTLWGELGWQLGGDQGYKLVEASDRDGTSPGKKVLVELFTKYSPCVVLIDETVAYLRQFEDGKQYSGGTFDSNLSFFQALTESAEQTNMVLLASLPESDMEVGGERGKVALAQIQKIFGRKEAIWKPVATHEGFEIVRRRLFGKIKDTKTRDAVSRAFADLYVENKGQFPSETVEAAYLTQLTDSYPIHPEVFERLYKDWASLEHFQRTRGVLRLMAMVIHRLWADGNTDLLVMPGSFPLYDPQVDNELNRYLPQGWDAVIENDIDGDEAVPTEMDKKNPLGGSVQAARRVARTIFLGSAPSVAAQRVRGVNAQRVRLGCAQPGQQIGRYDDALKHLEDQLHHLYTGNDRYWYDTRPNLRREMEDRLSRFQRDEHLIPEIQNRVRNLVRGGPFSGVHVFTGHEDIPDDESVRLVVLSPAAPHRGKTPKSRAVDAASTINTQRGQQPRQNQNRLVFLAADEDASTHLWDQVKRFMAWDSIVNDTALLNLDQHQIKESKDNRDEADGRVSAAVKEVYRWVLVPAQEANSKGGAKDVFWGEKSLQSAGSNPMEAIEKLCVENEFIYPRWSPIHLRDMLREWFWKDDRPEVTVKEVWKAVCCYPYLPRLVDTHVLFETISAGIGSQDFFAFATGKEDGRYLGLLFGKQGTVYKDEVSILINPVAAKAQIEREALARQAGMVKDGTAPSTPEVTPSGKTPIAGGLPGTSAPQSKPMKRFHGSVPLDPVKMGIEAARIADEVVQHFTSQYGTKVKITMEIEAESPGGVSDSTRRIVQENANTLRFNIAEFEEE